MSEGSKKSWPVGESRIESQAGKEDSDRCQTGKGECNRSQGGKGDSDRQEWQVVNRGKVVGLRKDRTETVECSNRFSLLMGESKRGMDEVIVVKDKKEKEGEGKGRKGVSGPPQVLVVGDSQVRYLDSTFSRRDKGRRSRVCMPGAGVKAVSEEAQRRVCEMEKDGVVVIHVGGNDVRAGGSEELVDRYREMLGKIKESGRRCVVSGVLPRFSVSREWLSRAIGVNERVKVLCKKVGVSFVDEWDGFFGQRELYAMDGVHLSRKGVETLSKCIERAVGIECSG